MRNLVIRMICICLLISIFLPLNVSYASPSVYFDESAYQKRKTAYIEQGVWDESNDALVLQAYAGEELNQKSLQDFLNVLRNGGQKNSDFTLTKLIRVLMFRPEIKDELVEALEGYHFWFREGGTGDHVFSSENHMLMYTSSQYLLQEKYGLYEDERTYKRLKKYLEVKNQYGFYEFYSPNYYPYTLSALLNLVDFTEDEEIRQLASGAAQRLLQDVLFVTNDEGAFFAASGRTNDGYRSNGLNANINRIIYLVTGIGNDKARTPSPIGVMLATSDLEISDDVFRYFGKPINMTYSNGHSLGEAMNTIYKDFPRAERVPFYWTQGAYFHPDVAADTAWFASRYKLQGYESLKAFDRFLGLSESAAPAAAKAGAVFSRSSVLSQANFAMYKDGGVMLHSLQDYWPGRQGYQQNPWIATTGTKSVWTKSGDGGGSSVMQNDHLPKIKQMNNVAVIQYNPYPEIEAYHAGGSNVSLYWPNGFDEEIRNGNWKFGKEDDGYVAVRYPCGNGDAEKVTCDWNEQTWVTIVGTKEKYGSFNQFKQKVLSEVQYDADWEWHGSFWKGTLKYVYDSDVKFDGTDISLTW
ncbi:hypothetical protein IC620_14565 [Hazenella sp. IB182357]|uniref:Uncharacterized protein n=1 Tax=Polycladospora coralii TaxID=2771432 RepID=A0A926NBK3_9BACL|nr:hypothetical protein [Polycladospora coralii]MBD1373568.1 hypothetical protein [Polycladospora coralii]MBS7531941.1 hypothetical protein [Polycladospora coralii]